MLPSRAMELMTKNKLGAVLFSAMLAIPYGCDDGDDSGDEEDATSGADDGTSTSTSTSGSDSSGTTTESSESETVSPEEAEEYFQTVCGLCHGPEGAGVQNLGPEIQHPVRDYFTWVIRNGRPTGEHAYFPGSAMIPYDDNNVPDDMVAAILDYLDTPPAATDGEGLFKDHCGHCHGDAGEGPAPISKPLAAPPLADVMTNVRGGHLPGEYENRAGYMPAWDATAISDAELQLITDYLATL